MMIYAMIRCLQGKNDPTGGNRIRKRDKGKPLAGKSTLNRLELTPVGADEESRYKKIPLDCRAAENVFTEIFLQSYDKAPSRIILDLDATDDPIHGHQLGRFFHGYYKSYCYLPLYVFCGDHLLCGKLRPSDIDAAAGSVKQLDRIITRIRQEWPNVEIIIRGDSGFCRELIMNWCELHNVDYILGLAKNERLKAEITHEMELAKAQCSTIRLKLLKIGAQIRVTVRKVWVSLAESYPYRRIFKQVYENLTRPCPVPMRC